MQADPHYQLKIVRTEIVSDVVYYQIQVLNTATKVSWSFKERYSNMLKLHSSVASVVKKDLPQFPGKKFLGNTDPEFISTRKAALQNYFKTLLSLVNPDQIEPLKSFLTKGEQKIVKESIHHQQEPKIEQQQQSNNNAPLKEKQQNLQQQRNALKQKLQQACEKARSNFIDLQQMMNAPEEVDIKKKRLVYDQVKVPILNGSVIQIPECSNMAKQSIAEPTIDFKHPQLLELLENMVKDIDNIL